MAPGRRMTSSHEPLPGLLKSFRDDPRHSGVFTDFDGTLSSVVGIPDNAVPLPGVVNILGRLATSYATVAVISGRPLPFLQAHFPAEVVLSGHYGLEVQRDGVVERHRDATRWEPVVAGVVAAARAVFPPEVIVEPKGLSLTVHYRARPDFQSTIERWAADESARTGLVVAAARKSVELNPPIDVDKGAVVTRLATGLDRVCYFGDDAADVFAFEALHTLRAAGIETVAVAVVGPETPLAVRDTADMTVASPEAAVSVLAALVPSSDASGTSVNRLQ